MAPERKEMYYLKALLEYDDPPAFENAVSLEAWRLPEASGASWVWGAAQPVGEIYEAEERALVLVQAFLECVEAASQEEPAVLHDDEFAVW